MNQEKSFSFAPEVIKFFTLRKIKKEGYLLCFSFLIFIVLASFGVKDNIFDPQISPEQIIKESAVKYVRTVSGQPIKWIKVVTTDSVRGNKKYLELPKGAEDIIINKGEAAKEVFLNPEQRINSDKAIKIPQAIKKTTNSFEWSGLLTNVWGSFTASFKTVAASLIISGDKEPVIIEVGGNKFLDLQTLGDLPKQSLITVEYYIKAP